VIGANPTENHPVAATFKNAVRKRGAKLIVADPRAHRAVAPRLTHAAVQAGTDVALLNAMLHVIVEEVSSTKDFIPDAPAGFEALGKRRGFSPKAMAPICGIGGNDARSGAALRDVERLR
jgi:formate dehydrogenase major subunit